MIFLCLVCLSLVLGGVAGSLWYAEALRGKWLRVARVPAPVRRPVWHLSQRTSELTLRQEDALPPTGGGGLPRPNGPGPVSGRVPRGTVPYRLRPGRR